MPTILIAEDDFLTADMLAEVLARAGYDVCGIARTVGEAIDLADRHQLDFAILDMRLADGGLGVEIAEALSRRGKIGIIYATGNLDFAQLHGSHGQACMAKPFHPQDMIRALKIVGEIVETGTSASPFPWGFHLLDAGMTAPKSESRHG